MQKFVALLPAIVAIVAVALLIICALHGQSTIPKDYYLYARAIKTEAYSHWGVEVDATRFPPQIHQESWFRPGAKSTAGAAGLTQFMPKTRDWINQLFPDQLSEWAGEADTRFNPYWSIRAMILYDKWLWDRVSGATERDHWAFTYSAYNGGLTWVHRDQQLASPYCDQYCWDCVAGYSKRAKWAIKENRGYVDRIYNLWNALYRTEGTVIP